MLIHDELNPHLVHGQRAAEGAGFAHEQSTLLA
jgi:hypothetical protein